MRAIFSGCC